MFKKILIIISLLLYVNLIFSVTNISTCQDITSPGNYVLTTDISTTSTCFQINANNITLNLNNHTITGDTDSSDFGVDIDSNIGSYSGNIIKNGIIENFGIGINSNTGWNEEFSIDNVNLSSNTVYDLKLDSGTINKTIINNSIFTKFYFWDIGSLNIENSYILNGSCGGKLGSIVNFTGEFKLGEDISSTSTCFNIESNNIVFNLDGHSVSTNESAFRIDSNSVADYSGIEIKNGFLKNSWYGVYSDNLDSFLIDNITFNSNSINDIYAMDSDSVSVYNSIFNQSLYFDLINTLNFAGNTINSATDITHTITNENWNVLLNGSQVGNYWGDFVCSDTSNKHNVINSPYEYTICDSNDYNVNSVSDLNPLISVDQIEISTCQDITSPGNYILTQDLLNQSTTTCFKILTSNVTLDLGGYRVDGTRNTGKYGIFYNDSSEDITNVIIKNGILSDWDASFFSDIAGNYAVDIILDNIQFENNKNNDIEIYGNSGDNITIKNSNFTQKSTIENINLLNFNSSNRLNACGGFSTYHVLNFEGEYVLGKSFYNLSSELINDPFGSGNDYCFLIDMSNIIFNLNGNTLDGSYFSSDVAFILYDGDQDATNVVIKNGILSDWDKAIYSESGSTAYSFNVTFENISVINSKSVDMEIYGSNNDDFYFENSNFSGSFILEDMGSINFAGNNLTSGNDFNLFNVVSENFNMNFGGSQVGNHWSDFVCSEPSTHTNVTYNGIIYSICNSNDYSVNGISDNNPRIYNLTGGTGFTGTVLSACQAITSPGTYGITSNLLLASSPAICFEIQSNNIIFDCNNNTIDGPGSSTAFKNWGYDNFKLKNCVIENFSTAIKAGNDLSNNFYSNLSFNSNLNFDFDFENIHNTIFKNILINNSKTMTIGRIENSIFKNISIINSDDLEINLDTNNNLTLENISVINSSTLYGIYFKEVSDSNLKNIYIFNSNNGIFLDSNGNDNNYFSNITLLNNSNYGFYMKNSVNNTIINSTIKNNSIYNIYFYDSDNNFLANNIFGDSTKINIRNAGSHPNYFNYTVDGHNIGNYWSDFTTCSDSETRGDYEVCLNPNNYTVDVNSIDYAPLIIPPEKPNYIQPTPADNSNYGNTKIIIQIEDTSGLLTWLNVTINNQNYSMTNISGNIWQFTYEENLNSIQNITFQAYYESGNLNQRSFTFYPDHSKNSLPAFGIISVLISIILLLFQFNFKQKNNKAITPAIATVMLLFITITSFVVLNSFFSETISNYQDKSFQNNNLNSIKILDFKEELGKYNLYIRNDKNDYIILNKIKVNNNYCNLTMNNVILEHSISKIEIDCPSYLPMNEIQLHTSANLIQTNKKIN